MPAIYQRSLALPDRSFLLVGPRGTGKITWLRQVLPGTEWFDLFTDGDRAGTDA